MKILTPGERRRLATITVTEPCIHGLDAAHEECAGPVTTTIPFPRNPGTIPIAIAGAMQEDDPAGNDPSILPDPAPPEPPPAPEPVINTNELRRTDPMTTLKLRAREDWQQWAIIAAHALIVWPFQYLFAAPVVTATSWAWGLIKAAAKIGIGALALLFIPVIGWVILAAWIIVRNQDRREERRHTETMAALGVQYQAAEETAPLWQRIWAPWKIGW